MLRPPWNIFIAYKRAPFHRFIGIMDSVARFLKLLIAILKIVTDRNHKILLTLLALTIVGEIASIAIWYNQPDLRMTLIVDYSTASFAAASVAALNTVALIGVLRKNKWGSILVIAISIPNRIVGLFLFESPASTGIFAIWTLLLVVFAYLDYREY